jgi:phosphomannomutase/phosphomannomutase/phosphoglucomutase
LNEDVAYRVGKAFVMARGASVVVVGGDNRHSSETLKKALAQGIIDAGAEVVDLGMTGTEEVYFASFYLKVDGGIQVTASHNPIDYNGMKLVGKDAEPISGDSGLHAIRDLAATLSSPFSDFSAENGVSKCDTGSSINRQQRYRAQSIIAPYVDHLLTYIDLRKLKPLRVVVNPGNGAAGHVIDAIEEKLSSKHIPVEFIKVNHEPDGSFPNGIPNPLLPENRHATIDAIKHCQADFGIAWDGDFDRCFLFDENARFIEGYYIVGLLAKAFLKKSAGEKIIYDPRLTWNTIDEVAEAGGIAIQSKTGHAFIKERMRKENAVYGGEMSAHHYFRDFAYCDSGMIPWLLVAELVSESGKPLSTLVDERIELYPCSGEINYQVDDVAKTLSKIVDSYLPGNREANNETSSEGGRNSFTSPLLDKTDGISLEFPDWRFNLRGSNTEPLLRLNVESRADALLVEKKVQEIENLIRS